MIKRMRHQSSFHARDEEGNERLLDVYVKVLHARTHGNPNAEIEGLKSIRTEHGGKINRIEKGEYMVVDSGEILTSDDPDAP